jgi:hypothetical protein
MSLMRTVALACCCAVAVCLIAACSGGGGGGGGGPPPQFVVSPANLSFSAASPNAARPASQPIMATVNGVSANALFVRIVITGPAVTSVDNLVVTGPNSGQMMVHVADPGTIGPGNHASVITVTACTTDINCSGPQLTGSPATINVAYQVGTVPAPPQAVAPSVGTSGVSGGVILRGSGFTPVTSVSFGGLQALSFTVMSSTEIRATYPPLTAGAKAIALNGGAIPFGATLQIVDTPAFTSTTLPYPAAIQSMRGLAYDARHSALFVGANFTASVNQLWRYRFNGTTWQAPDIVQVGNLRDLILSPDGAKLLTITDAALVEIDPVTLVQQVPIVPPPPIGGPAFGAILKAIVAANDGQAVVLNGGPNLGRRWLYSIASRTFTPASLDFYSLPVAGGPGNGSRVALIQGGISPAQPIRQYSASSGVISATAVAIAHSPGVAINDENVNPPVFDRSGTRMIVGFDAGGFGVFDANFGELGRLLPVANAIIAGYALSHDGKRAYALDVGAALCQVRAFDLDVAPPGAGNPFLATGTPVDLTLANCPAPNFESPVRMLLDPSGTTLFIAGTQSIAVVTPLP